MAELPTKPTIEFIPPQFNREDLDIWMRWKDELTRRYHAVEYSVGLGGTRPIIPETVALGKMWEVITNRRIDAVGHAADHIALIEFRRFAGPSAIGQLIMYRALYKREIKPTLPIKLVLVTDSITDAIVLAAADIGIEVALVKA